VVSAVALLFHVPMLAALMFIDVMTSIMELSVVDEALLDRHRLLASRRWLLVDRPFSLISSWLFSTSRS